MKKTIYIVLSLVFASIIIISCNKNNGSNYEPISSREEPIEVQSIPWPININIDIPFDNVRLARATTNRGRDGKNCGCNECFGVCNEPHSSIPTNKIAVQLISVSEAILYFLDEKPESFEIDFGVDEVVTIGHPGGNQYTFAIGEYPTVDETGTAYCPENQNSYSYFGKVFVNLIPSLPTTE